MSGSPRSPSLAAFDAFADEVTRLARGVEGYLTDREARFLALLAAYPTAGGVVLEIGSHKGKSTVILARAAAFGSAGPVVAVDPLTSPSPTDPDLKGAASVLPEFRENLRRAGVQDLVEFHAMTSAELAARWEAGRRIRLLWIDGNHTYEGARTDLEMFMRFLSPGSIVAFHDVLHRFEGPVRVFTESVLLSERFGPAGLCGSIGWAQFIGDATASAADHDRRAGLDRKLRRLVPFSRPEETRGPLAGLRYRFWRSRLPHGDVIPSEWLARVGRTGMGRST